jgi:hypothetical protein
LNGSLRIIAEHSASVGAVAGSFNIFRTAANAYTFASRGSSSAANATSGASAQPHNAILICDGKISSDSSGVAVNSGARAGSATDQGTGNYGNHLFNIGSRNASSLYFNGEAAALCVVGLQPSSLPSGWLETMTGLLVPPEATFT